MIRSTVIPLLCCCISLSGCRRDAEATTIVLRQATAGSGDSAEIGEPFRMARTNDGHLFLASSVLQDGVGVMNEGGQVVGHLGRVGDGPGEFRAVAMLLDDGNRIIIGTYAARFHFFSSTGKFLRTVPGLVPGASQAVVLRGDSMLVAQPMFDQEHFGLPLHLVEPGGSIVRSFGSEDRSIDNDFQGPLFRVVASATDSSFWVARRDAYVIELWDTSGKMERRLSLRREWFPPMTHDEKGIDRERPSTQITAISAMSGNHLLVLLRRARPDWKSTAEGNAGGERQSVPAMKVMDYLEQVVEVVNTDSGELIGSVVNRTDLLRGFLTGGFVYGVRGDSLGRIHPVVWKVVLNPN